MFRFADMDQVLWPVELPQRDDSGAETTVKVLFRFKLLPRKVLHERQLQALRRMSAAGTTDVNAESVDDLIHVAEAAAEREAGDTDLLMAHTLGWSGITDGDVDVAFSPDRLRALLEFDVYYRPIMAGLHAASRHAPSKNLQPGPGGAPVVVQA